MSSKSRNISVYIYLLYCVTVEGILETSKITFIGDFFSSHDVHVISSFTCSSRDNLWLTKSLVMRQFWMILSDSQDPASSTSIFSSDVFSDNFFKLGVFLDYSCEANKQLFRESSTRNLLTSSYKWLIWSNELAVDESHAEYNIDSDVTWATPSADMRRILLHDIYKANGLVVTPSGIWNNIQGLVLQFKNLKCTRRRNLQGVSLPATIVVNGIPTDDIETRLASPVNRYTDSMARYHYAVYSHLREWFNFKFQLRITSSYGYLTENGSFDGLVGFLQRNETEIGISAVRLLPKRLEVVDFSAPTWLFRNPIIFRHPQTAAMPNALLQPFTIPVWLCSGASWLIVMVTLRFIVIIEARLQRHSESSESVDKTWGTAFITTVGIIAEQGAELEHKWTAWRVLFLFALIQTVILNNYYGASLVSSLVSPSTKTIRTIQDIIDSSLKVGYMNISYNKDFFLRTTDPQVKKLYTKKVCPPSQTLPNEFERDVAVKKMKDESFAIQAEAISLYPLIEKIFTDDEKCSLTEIEAFRAGMLYSVIRKKSPYRKLITYGFRAMTERGLMKRQLKQWRPSVPQCYGTNEVEGIELEAISLALILLAVGIITAFAILMMECSYLSNRCTLKHNTHCKIKYNSCCSAAHSHLDKME